MVLRVFGNLFHHFRPTQLKDLVAKVLSFVFGSTNHLSWCWLLSPCLLSAYRYSIRSLSKYSGTPHDRHLWTIVKILCSFLLWIGSQCNFTKILLELLSFMVTSFKTTIFAAMFWICCILDMSTSGRPTSTCYCNSLDVTLLSLGPEFLLPPGLISAWCSWFTEC